MKRVDLLNHLRDEGCVLVRTVGKHDWWRNVITGVAQPIPRHREIKEFTARAIIRKLSSPKPEA